MPVSGGCLLCTLLWRHGSPFVHCLADAEVDVNLTPPPARQPDGEANVGMMLGEYRKLDPGPVEEFIFFDYPSGRTRITAAMRWKAEHPGSASAEEMTRKIFTEK